MGIIASVGTTPKMFGGQLSGLFGGLTPPTTQPKDGGFKSIGELKEEIKTLGKSIEVASSTKEVRELRKQQEKFENTIKGLLSTKDQPSMFASAITLPITDAIGYVKKGINKLVNASPLLSAEMKKLGIAMRFLLMPIGNVVANFLKPWIMKFNRVAFQFYTDYQSGGLLTAIGGAIKGAFGIGKDEDVTAGGVISGIPKVTELAAQLVIGGAMVKGGVGLLKAVADWLKIGGGAAAGAGAASGGLLIPAIITIGALTIGSAFGYSDFEKGLIAVMAVGAYPFFGATGAAIAIPVTIVLTEIVHGLQDVFSEANLGDTAGGFVSGVQRKIKEALAGEEPVENYLKNVEDILADESGFTPNGMISAAKTSSSWWSSVVDNIKTWLVGPEDSVMTAQDQIGDNAIEEGEKVGELSSQVNALPNIERHITYHVNFVNGSGG